MRPRLALRLSARDLALCNELREWLGAPSLGDVLIHALHRLGSDTKAARDRALAEAGSTPKKTTAAR